MTAIKALHKATHRRIAKLDLKFKDTFLIEVGDTERVEVITDEEVDSKPVSVAKGLPIVTIADKDFNLLARQDPATKLIDFSVLGTDKPTAFLVHVHAPHNDNTNFFWNIIHVNLEHVGANILSIIATAPATKEQTETLNKRFPEWFDRTVALHASLDFKTESREMVV